MAEHPAVREAVVLLREDAPGDKRLVAYVVPLGAGRGPTREALRRFLRQRLPELHGAGGVRAPRPRCR